MDKRYYKVAIVETLRRVVTVEAEDEMDAHQKVSDGWHNTKYILDSDYFEGAEFHVLGEASQEDYEREKAGESAGYGKEADAK